MASGHRQAAACNPSYYKETRSNARWMLSRALARELEKRLAPASYRVRNTLPAVQPTRSPHNFVRLLRDGWGATFSATAFDELRQRLMHAWIHGGRLEGNKSVAPQGTCALGRRLGASVRPCAEVPPI